jgi:16S rRNA (cytosine1402-N4)-methyltransferase
MREGNNMLGETSALSEQNTYQTQHIPVFAQQLVDALNPQPGAIYVDATLGGGGHFSILLERMQFTGKVIATDVNAEALGLVKTQLLKSGFATVPVTYKVNPAIHSISLLQKGSLEVYLVQANFAEIEIILSTLKIKQVNGIMADLGFSSDELDSIPGLSFRRMDDRLDMRLDKDNKTLPTAEFLLNNLTANDLLAIFTEFGNVNFVIARKLVAAIVRQRATRAFTRVSHLVGIIPTKDSGLMAQVFQSLRIAVNRELEVLKDFLASSFKSLGKDGRLAVITFHSGEANLVGEFLLNLQKEDKSTNQYTEEFVRPSVNELRQNLRARSAKLFACLKK